MKNTKYLFVLTLFFFFAKYSSANPLIAAHPTDSKIAFVGENHVLYILDKESFKVLKRVPLKNKINPFNKLFTYNNDGTKLFIDLWQEGLQIIETENYSTVKSFKVSGESAVSHDKTVLAFFDDGTLKIYNTQSGNQVSSFSIDMVEDDDVRGFSISEDNKNLMFWCDKENSSEEKIDYKYSDFDGLTTTEKLNKTMKNDGESSYLFTVDISSKEKTPNTETWVSDFRDVSLFSYNEGIIVVDEGIYYFPKDGDLKIAEMESSSSSEGNGIDYENKTVFSLNSDHVSIVSLEDFSTQSVKLDLWMIRVTDAVLDDGWFYYCTDHYRIGAINKDGGLKDMVHIY